MRTLVLIFTFILINACYQGQRDCGKFKTGTYSFEAFVGTQLTKTRFVRNDTLEIDYFQGKTDTAAVRWINDCEFILTKLNPKTRNEQKPVHIKILSTKKNTYTFEYGLVGDKKNKQKGTATKIN